MLQNVDADDRSLLLGVTTAVVQRTCKALTSAFYERR